jgi:hypothetical protein
VNGLAAAIEELVAEIARGAWFAACGEELTESERIDARLLAGALGFAGTELAPASDWQEAAHLTQRQDWSRAWWDAESAAEAALKADAIARFGEAAILEQLSRVMLAAAALNGAAAMALARAHVADEALARVAAGAAAQACHQAALARAADAGPGHAFAAKFRLFAGGRWPLGVVGGRLFVF